MTPLETHNCSRCLSELHTALRHTFQTAQLARKEVHDRQSLLSIFGHAVVGFLPLMVFHILEGSRGGLDNILGCHQALGSTEEQDRCLDPGSINQHR